MTAPLGLLSAQAENAWTLLIQKGQQTMPEENKDTKPDPPVSDDKAPKKTGILWILLPAAFVIAMPVFLISTGNTFYQVIGVLGLAGLGLAYFSGRGNTKK